MGSPISPSDIVAITKFAWKLYDGCMKAPDEFAAVGDQVASMHLILDLLQTVLDKKGSILSERNKNGATLQQGLKVQGGRCLGNLQELEKLLEKYRGMNILDSIMWFAKGKTEVAELQAQMATSTTQLNTFFLGGMFLGQIDVNRNVQNIKGMVRELNPIEDAMMRNQNDEKKAVKEVMEVVKSVLGVEGKSSSTECTKKYKSVIEDYAKEIKKSREADGKGRRPTKPDDRGRTPKPEQKAKESKGDQEASAVPNTKVKKVEGKENKEKENRPRKEEEKEKNQAEKKQKAKVENLEGKVAQKKSVPAFRLDKKSHRGRSAKLEWPQEVPTRLRVHLCCDDCKRKLRSTLKDLPRVHDVGIEGWSSALVTVSGHEKERDILEQARIVIPTAIPWNNSSDAIDEYSSKATYAKHH